MRTGGPRQTPCSVSFATGQARPIRYHCGYGYCVTANATPGSDFEAVAGQLDWADGEEAEREITVMIFNDDVDDPNERFSIQLSNPEGGVLDPGQFVDVGIFDDDEASGAESVSAKYSCVATDWWRGRVAVLGDAARGVGIVARASTSQGRAGRQPGHPAALAIHALILLGAPRPGQAEATSIRTMARAADCHHRPPSCLRCRATGS